MCNGALAGVLVVALAALIGCVPKTPPRGIGCYLDRDALPGRVQRVLFVPLADDANCPSAADGMTRALYSALQDRQLFHIGMLAPADTPTDEPAVDPRRALVMKDLLRMRQTSKGDAALLGTVNLFKPYPQMQIGVCLRLVDLRDGRVLWAIEHVWDATDRVTQERMEIYFHKQRGEDYDPLDWRLATVSPAAFQQFAAYEMAETLPDGAASPDAGREGAVEKTLEKLRSWRKEL